MQENAKHFLMQHKVLLSICMQVFWAPFLKDKSLSNQNFVQDFVFECGDTSLRFESVALSASSRITWVLIDDFLPALPKFRQHNGAILQNGKIFV